MKKAKKVPGRRNPLVLAMTLHCKGGKMKKRGPRGGAKNLQQEWRDELNFKD